MQEFLDPEMSDQNDIPRALTKIAKLTSRIVIQDALDPHIRSLYFNISKRVVLYTLNALLVRSLVIIRYSCVLLVY